MFEFYVLMIFCGGTALMFCLGYCIQILAFKLIKKHKQLRQRKDKQKAMKAEKNRFNKYNIKLSK